MSTQFEHLFSPITIGQVELKNRLSFSAHSTFLPIDGLANERQAHYFAERAKGGVGWIVIGNSVVHESSMDNGGTNLVSDERAIPGYRKIAEAVHEHGTKISTELDHMGPALHYPRDARSPLLAPSALVDTGNAETPKAMEREDIEMLIEASERGAANAKEAGLDGIEFLVSMGFSLMENFLSPRLNRRTDEYGGSIENRMRYPLQLIERVRKVVGPEMMVGVKWTSDELVEGGVSHEESLEIGERFAASGLIDYIHACLGSTNNTSVWMPTMDYPAGFAAPYAASLRERVDIPVLAVKRINDPIAAEQLLAEGQADMIAMARALIADPELPNKALAGELDAIRQCTGTNQECVARGSRLIPQSCIHNPVVGFEEKWGVGSIVKAESPGRVTVIGGGPAGMKAAELAAQRGHTVDLYERSDALGGQVRWITSVNSRKDFESVTRFLTYQMKKLEVNVHLGHEVTADELLGGEVGTVVVATGAAPLKTGFSAAVPSVEEMPGVSQDNVFTVFDVFADLGRVGQKVVVVDEFGDAEASMVAEYLADAGREVEILTRASHVGYHLVGAMAFEDLIVRLNERGVRYRGFTGVNAIEGNTVLAADGLTGEEVTREADSIVLCMGKATEDRLYWDLKGKIPKLHRIGDCVAPRRITDAVWEGNVVGRLV